MQEFLYISSADIPRYYTAIAEWLCCMLYCLRGPRSLGAPTTAVVAVVTLVIQTGWLVLTGNVPVILWMPCMLAAILCMYMFLYVTLEVSIMAVTYCCMKAFLAAEFMAALEWQIEHYVYRDLPGHGPLRFVILAIVYGLTILILWYVERTTQKEEVETDLTRKELFGTLLIVIAAFLLSNLSFVYSDSMFSGTLTSDIYTIRTLVDLAGLAILYAYQSLRSENNAEKELAQIQSMLSAQYDSYRNYQEVTDLINMKYHDLKHQIAGLRAEQDADRRAEWIDQLEGELASYRPERQTGNQVLDGVIDGKMPTIRRGGIQFTCVADGALLSFMHVTDICTIFGNALDNAIEHVLLVPEPDRRIIHMEVSQRRQFVYIEVRNYCEQEIRIKNGFPITTKQDAQNHGFGVKSISYTARKYGGTVQFGVQDHIFSMQVLIPQTQ